jgi:tRNA A-37 threonylcarbamoyl transferase component Bud32
MPASTRSKDPQPPKTHILDFFYDDDDGCAFTARINDERFHVIVDPERLKAKDDADHDMLAEYRTWLTAVREHDKAEEGEENQNDGEKTSNRSTDRDSGVDVSGDDDHHTHDQKISDKVLAEGNPALKLQNWVLQHFASEVPQQNESEDTDDADPQVSQKNLQQWYETPIHYYEVELAEDGKSLSPVQLEESEELRKKVDDLQPHVALPKTLRSLPIPWVHPATITVLAESEDPPPVHPSLVSATLKDTDKQNYFFKQVDTTQPQPTKREIDLLHKIHSKGLSSQFNVPQIHALVSHGNSHVETMGFLLTAIDDPIPLTKLLDSEVDESKRKKWAKESQRIVDLLHENGIVWGDAKADNFLVDKQNELWVIDFGGSYTEGWVDPELNETVEGDNMGVERIVNGLLEPDEMTCDPDAGLDGPGKVREEAEDHSTVPREQQSPSLDGDTSSTNLAEEEGYTIKCTCSSAEDDGSTVYCEKCDTWQHIECYYPSKKVPDEHLCSDCLEEGATEKNEKGSARRKRSRDEADDASASGSDSEDRGKRSRR